MIAILIGEADPADRAASDVAETAEITITPTASGSKSFHVRSLFKSTALPLSNLVNVA
jgi:hypothetical protein